MMNRYHAQLLPARMAMNPKTHVNPVVQKIATLRRRNGVVLPFFSFASDRATMHINALVTRNMRRLKEIETMSGTTNAISADSR